MKKLQRFGLMILVLAMTFCSTPALLDAACTPGCVCANYTITNNTPVALFVNITFCNGALRVVGAPANSVVQGAGPGPCIFLVGLPAFGIICFCPGVCPLPAPFNNVIVNSCSITIN